MSDAVKDCAICLESLTDDAYIPLLTATKSCGHQYHLACLVRAAKECRSRFSDPRNCPWCPICKQRMQWLYPVKEGERIIVEVDYAPPHAGMKRRQHEMRFEEKRVATKGVDKNFRPIEPVPERTKWFDAYEVVGTATEDSEEAGTAFQTENEERNVRDIIQEWIIAPILLALAGTISEKKFTLSTLINVKNYGASKDLGIRPDKIIIL